MQITDAKRVLFNILQKKLHKNSGMNFHILQSVDFVEVTNQIFFIFFRKASAALCYFAL